MRKSHRYYYYYYSNNNIQIKIILRNITWYFIFNIFSKWSISNIIIILLRNIWKKIVFLEIIFFCEEIIKIIIKL